MKNELKKAYIDRLNELLDIPTVNAKIQLDYNHDEIPTIRYDIVEMIIPKKESEDYDVVKRMSPVTPQPKKGWWLHREDMDYLDKNKVIHKHFMCKDCGFIHDFIDGHTAQYKYCPKCGLKMFEKKEIRW